MVANGNKVEEEAHCSNPKGGPIYIPNHISTLTTVPEFQYSPLYELQELEAELISAQLTDAEGICVDDLKILKGEELAEMALKEAFKEDEHIGNNVQRLENGSNLGDRRKSGNKLALVESTGVRNTSTSMESTNGSPCDTDLEGDAMEKKNGLKKRKIRKANNCLVDNMYIKKVEQLAKIKQKQDEDKATAGLHSLNKINDCAIPISNKNERMKSLWSQNLSRKVKSWDVKEHIPVLYPEVVLCVEVYHNIQKWSKIQEFLVLGCQTLSELKDKIYCLTDQLMQKAGLHDPSGYFLIEGMFLND